jgi:hypothetical protein
MKWLVEMLREYNVLREYKCIYCLAEHPVKQIYCRICKRKQ